MQLNDFPLKKLSTDLAPFSLNEPDRFDPMLDFDFNAVQDYSSASRENITKIGQNLFGAAPENEELVSRLTEYMLSVKASRKKIASELVLLGGSLVNSMTLIVENHTAKAGVSPHTVNQGRNLAYTYFQESLQLTSHAARKYMRCFQKFGDDNEAIQLFNIGELNILSAHDVTDAQISAVMTAKMANRKMTQADMQEILNEMRKHEEALEDKDKELENIQGLLEDSKDQLRGVEADSKHLKRQVSELNRQLQEREKQLQTQSDFVKERTSGLGQLQKDYQDKVKELDNTLLELNAIKNAKPSVEIQTEIVEKVPEGYTTLSEAYKERMAALERAEAMKKTVENELAEMQAKVATSRAAIESENAVQQTLTELITTWEPFAAKFATAQLAVQASKEPARYTPTLQALAAMLRKCLSELDGAAEQ
jgi:DNA repair exonuclease SbcCD ATPase subunit